MAHGVLSIDAAGKVASHNRQASRLLGIPPATIDGLDLRTVIDFDSTGIRQTLDPGIPVLNHEFDYRRQQGDLLPLSLTVTPIRDETGNHSGAVVVMRDMRPIRQLEAQVRRTEKLAAIGRLAAGVAHEIRNPLSSIRGFAYLLGRGHAEQAPEREYADVMVREIDRINHVVTDLLNFARPMTLELGTVGVGDLIDHLVSLVSADAADQGIDIQVNVAADMPSFRLDPNQTTQALLNLMLNAIKAMDTGGTIAIHAAVCHDGQAVCIQVEDNGPGIAADLQDKIFEPFYTTRQQGAGLGLAMVRKIAEQHAGKISVDSPPPGKHTGACFTLLLKDMES
jgi:two-component system sensor histidine kinase HydH